MVTRQVPAVFGFVFWFLLYSVTLMSASQSQCSWCLESILGCDSLVPGWGSKHWYLFKTPRRPSRAEVLRTLSRFVWGWKGNSDLSPAFRLSQRSSSPWLDFWYRERCYISTVSEVERRECGVHCAKKWRVLRAAEQGPQWLPEAFPVCGAALPFSAEGCCGELTLHPVQESESR